nr:S8 family serine peptidase [Nannocystis pusilla]
MTFWDTFTRFLQPAPDPTTTICVPATADSCISVAGYEFQEPWTVPAGELGPWSSRGPRIDGGRTIDIAAPRDAYGPEPSPDQPDSSVYYTMPGGTSGAAPVVVAAVAQLLEAEPGLTSAQIRDRLRASAGVDEFVDVVDFPDDGWGYGKLRAYQALYDADAPARPDFVTRGLEVELQEGDGTCTAVVRVLDVDWPSSTFRWDDDYDGAWDTEFAATHERPIVLTPDDPTYAVRVEFGREGWRVGGAAVTGEVPASCFMGGGSESSSSGGSSETGDVTTGGSNTDGDEPTGSAGTGGAMTSTGAGVSDTAGASATAGGNDAADDGGCGCTTTPASAAWWSIVMLGLRRRRQSA